MTGGEFNTPQKSANSLLYCVSTPFFVQCLEKGGGLPPLILPPTYTHTTPILHSYYPYTIRIPPIYYTHTTHILYGCHPYTTLILPIYYTHTTHILHPYYPYTTSILPIYYTGATHSLLSTPL